MMRKKTTFGFALTCVLVAAAIAFTAGYLIAGNKVKNVTETSSTSDSQYALVEEVEKIISENYTVTAENDDLVRGMCKGYIESIGDSTVQYMTADEYSNSQKESAGETVIYENMGKGVGYIQFTDFTSNTKESFTKALTDFSGSSTSQVGMLILDLRDCNTGSIDVVGDLLDLLLPEGEIIAGIDKDGNRTVLRTSDSSELDYDIAVIVNGETKGVAEIFASTLSAYDKAQIIGTTTAGICAQTAAQQLSNGDYIVYPTLYYVTKGQQTYSDAGVVPSTIVEMTNAEQTAWENRTLEKTSDPQIVAALKALGINDIATTSSDSDTDSDSDLTDTDDEDTSAAASDDSTASDEESSTATTSDERDAYWDDDSYWDSLSSADDDYTYDEDDDTYYVDDYDYYDDEDWY